VPLIPLRAAVMVTDLPATTPVARPELLMVAMPVLEDDHVTDVVRVWLELSE
jgi:hypothetical protein